MFRVFCIDNDNFEGGRKQNVSIAGKDLGFLEHFQDGKWLEQRLNADDTASGKVEVLATNERKGSNAVISILEWLQ